VTFSARDGLKDFITMLEKDEKRLEGPPHEAYDASTKQPSKEAMPKQLPHRTLKKRIIDTYLRLNLYFLTYIAFYQIFIWLGGQPPLLRDVLKSRSWDDLVKTCETIWHSATKREVVGLMTEFYELLAEMGYYDAEIIERAPHERAINRALAAELGFSNEAVEMMNVLPYLQLKQVGEEPLRWSKGPVNNEFLLYGTFADLRNDDVLVESRDPMYGVDQFADPTEVFGEEAGKYMKPDYIWLMLLGNRGAVMILDVKTRKLMLEIKDFILMSCSKALDYSSRKGPDGTSRSSAHRHRA
jgi:hypothetical protein